ncbi:MAG: hypothetical protein LBU23_08305 [Planctomycetota bacterium]|jgi:hypothetical protein|nr:hypothetical protein [Planctomycetota bacterium]MDR1520126.1 hypothetical protein [Planctomycetota bacterium]
MAGKLGEILFGYGRGRAGSIAAGLAVLALAPLIGGCDERLFSYRTGDGPPPASQKVLILPFLDTRTFVDPGDAHKDDLGEHAREIFASALRSSKFGPAVEILAPPLPRREASLTNAQAAEIGRRQGADLVVAGQIFSFTGTRAASIPSRAGMFVRVIDADRGVLLFVGDNYQAAAMPGAAGGRERQARAVAARIIDGFFQRTAASLSRLGFSSDQALASLIAGRYRNEPAKEDYPGEGEADPPLPMPPPFLESEREEEVTDPGIAAESGPIPESGDAATVAETGGGESGAEEEAEERFEAGADDSPSPADIGELDELALRLTGDDLAADIFAEGEELLAEALAFRPVVIGSGRTAETAAGESESLAETIGPPDSPEPGGPEALKANPEGLDSAPEISPAEIAAENPSVAETLYADGPVVSLPLVSEQPWLASGDPRTAARASKELGGKEVGVLLLPYHDRDNPNNLIAATGGGEVVTGVFGAGLSGVSGLRLLWDATGQATHDQLLSPDEAVRMGRIAGADFVVRGQVVEFRRSQSVPSLYSAVISTAILAAQIMFAEMTGVDVATEVYRVSDGRCVVSRRDRAQQKYVVQAEKTVRRITAGVVAGLAEVFREEDPPEMDPLIDTLLPVTVFTNPRRGRPAEEFPAAN